MTISLVQFGIWTLIVFMGGMLAIGTLANELHAIRKRELDEYERRLKEWSDKREHSLQAVVEKVERMLEKI